MKELKIISKEVLEDAADAIRAKSGSSDPIAPEDFDDAIDAIETGITPTGTIQITQNGTGIDVTEYAAADVNVPNTYEAADEGKVVSNGALVAQTAKLDIITQNNTYDTTNYNSVTVNVPASASVSVLETPLGTVGNDQDIPSQVKQPVGPTIDAFFTVPPQHNQRIACVLRTQQGPDFRYACVVGTYNLNAGRLEDCIGYTFGLN